MCFAEYQLVLQCKLSLRAVCLVVCSKLIIAVVLDEVYACDVELRMLDLEFLVDLLQSEARPLCEEFGVFRCYLESEVLLCFYECEDSASEADVVYDFLALVLELAICFLD